MTNSTSPTTTSKASEEDFNPLYLFGLLLNGWKTILGCALLSLIIGITYSRYSYKPIYQTDALVKISDSKGVSALGNNISELMESGVSPVEDERMLIKSRLVLEPVVQKLHLDIELSNPELGFLDRMASPQQPTPTSDEAGVSLDTKNGSIEVNNFEVPKSYLNKPFTLTSTPEGFNLKLSSMPELMSLDGKLGEVSTFKLPEGPLVIRVNKLPTNGQQIAIKKLSMPAATKALNNSLLIQQQEKGTSYLQLVLTGPNQQQITRILDSIVDEYAYRNQALSTKETTTTLEFMESQIPELKKNLEESEEAFNRFREQYGTIDVSKEADILLSEKSRIEGQFSELNLKKAELLTYYTAEHPLVIQINDQIQEINARRNEITQMVAEMPVIQREFLKLSQDLDINREIYLTMLKNYQQLKIARAGQIGEVRVIDTPINTFDQTASQGPRVWAVSFLLGMSIGAFIILIRSLMYRTIKQADALESKTGVPVIATIPRSKKINQLQKSKPLGDSLLSVVDHNSVSYESIKSLRTSLLLYPPAVSKIKNDNKDRARIIVIAGESPDVGKSFVSANLAESFGQLGKRVLVIDGDMRLGEQHHTFIIDDHTGLADYLSQSIANTRLVTEDTLHRHKSNSEITVSAEDLATYVHRTGFDNIDLMPRGKKPSNPTSLLSSAHYEQLIIKLSDYYDYILIDTPPILAASDAILMAQFADQVIMVSRYNQTLEGQFINAINQLNKAQVKVSGIVINDMTSSIMSKYSDGYNYTYDHGSA